jgi:hypothetical protein
MSLQKVEPGSTEIVRIPGGYTLHRTADGATVVIPPGSCRQETSCR